MNDMNKDLQTIKKNLDYFRSLAFDCDKKQLGDILVEKFETVEKDLKHLEKLEKAIEIIKNKNVVIPLFKRTKTKSYYNERVNEDMYLFEAEFNLLKEVFENE